MKFTLKKAQQFSWEGLKGWAFNSKEEFSNASASYFEVTANHGRVLSAVSDRVYYVLEGEGNFTINSEIISVSATDVVIVPKNTPYDYRASEGSTLKLFLVHTPAYDEAKEEKLD